MRHHIPILPFGTIVRNIFSIESKLPITSSLQATNPSRDGWLAIDRTLVRYGQPGCNSTASSPMVTMRGRLRHQITFDKSAYYTAGAKWMIFNYCAFTFRCRENWRSRCSAKDTIDELALSQKVPSPTNNIGLSAALIIAAAFSRPSRLGSG